MQWYPYARNWFRGMDEYGWLVPGLACLAAIPREMILFILVLLHNDKFYG
jgi:hypothetical protein